MIQMNVQHRTVSYLPLAERREILTRNTKSGKHENFHGLFRVFGLSCFRDKMIFILSGLSGLDIRNIY